MNLVKMLSVLTAEPLLMDNSRREALLQLLNDHAQMSGVEFARTRTGVNQCGDRVELESMEVECGVAFIPVGGPIGMGLGAMEKGAGCVDVADIEADLDEAEFDDDVKSIALVFDSPGGMVSGTPELGDRIRAVEKPIWSFSNGGLIASAAYWLASATDGIFCTRSCDVGSIGVCAPFIDQSRAMEMKGVKVKVFASGKYKGMGTPGTVLTAEQEMLIQQRIMKIAEEFYAHVRANRTDVADDTMQGQVFKSAEAMDRGLIDHIVRDRADFMDMIS